MWEERTKYWCPSCNLQDGWFDVGDIINHPTTRMAPRYHPGKLLVNRTADEQAFTLSYVSWSRRKERLQLRIIRKHRGFSSQGDICQVRAVQGYGEEAAPFLVPQYVYQPVVRGDPNFPDCMVHGTTWDAVLGIFTSQVRGQEPIGLSCRGEHNIRFPGRGRTMVHASPYHPGDRRCRSGFRTDCRYAIYIDWEQLIHDGIRWQIT